MNAAASLESLVEQPFELLLEMERRSRAAVAGQSGTEQPSEWVGVGFRVGDEHFVADRNEVREVLMLPTTLTRVPGARRWLLGIANLRGHLLPLIDVKMLLGSGRTALRRATRVISVNHREIPAGLLVDEVLGFRRFGDADFVDQWPQTALRCDSFLNGAYRRGSETWPIFSLYQLVESNTFLQAAAE